MPADWLWQGINGEGITSFIAQEQWEKHVRKRPEIRNAFDLTVQAMLRPDKVEPDKHRQDEASRYFRLLTISAENIRSGYCLRVSVKYVQQPDGAWHKFYQSCWFERIK